MSDEPKTDKPDRKRWVWWLKAASAFALVCMLYILSTGPATWLMLKVDPELDGWPTTVDSWIYWPVLGQSRLATQNVGANWPTPAARMTA
ncbi:MAG TPA: hypothetical protein VGP76_04010 [Planctomycetaceae bacterium]|jgi:hypothetical protein|nr:hypothetical protein [Planctomycetaceae bacterium]